MKWYGCLSLFVFVLLYGCAATNVHTYPPIQLSPAVVLPTKNEVSGNKYKVFLEVQAFQGSGVELTKMNMDNIVRSTVEKLLLDTGNVSFTSSAQEADYHIQSNLKTARLTNNVVEGKALFYADILGTLKIFRGEKQELKDVIQVEDNAVEGVQSVSNNRDRILNTAIVNSITYGAGKKFYKLFSAKGYILSARRDEDEYYFEVTMGRDKLNVGDLMEVHTIERSLNPLTNEIEENDRIMAIAMVVDNSGSKRSWIKVKENGEHVRMGDFVRFSEKSGSALGRAWNKVTKKTKSFFQSAGQ